MFRYDSLCESSSWTKRETLFPSAAFGGTGISDTTNIGDITHRAMEQTVLHMNFSGISLTGCAKEAVLGMHM